MDSDDEIESDDESKSRDSDGNEKDIQQISGDSAADERPQYIDNGIQKADYSMEYQRKKKPE